MLRDQFSNAFQQRAFCSSSHRFHVRFNRRPEFELLNSLRDQHFKSANRLASGVARLTNKPRLGWIVNEIISQSHSTKLFGDGRSLFVTFTASAEWGCVNNHVKSFEVCVGEITTLDCQFVGDWLRLLQITNKQSDQRRI